MNPCPHCLERRRGEHALEVCAYPLGELPTYGICPTCRSEFLLIQHHLASCSIHLIPNDGKARPTCNCKADVRLEPHPHPHP